MKNITFTPATRTTIPFSKHALSWVKPLLGLCQEIATDPQQIAVLDHMLGSMSGEELIDLCAVAHYFAVPLVAQQCGKHLCLRVQADPADG